MRAKREPSYSDTELMPFGKHRGTPLQDVPADYFCFLWSKRPISDLKLDNYIWNSLDALRMEHPDGVWEGK